MPRRKAGQDPLENIYRTCAIITCSLYIFYSIFHCGLYCRAVSTTDNLCTKKKEILQILCQKNVVYDQNRLLIKTGL